MKAEEIAARYQRPEKEGTRRFVVDLALASGCRTALDLWGGGSSARALAAAGIDVTSADNRRAYHAALARDAETHGYRSHAGNVEKVRGIYDLVWFDSCGFVSRKMHRSLQRLVPKVGKWLIVTLMPEREADEYLVMARGATIPAWLTYTTGMKIEYITRYRRNDSNQEMWFAVLSHAEGDAPIYPRTLGLMLSHPRRRRWVGRGFHEAFPQLAPTTNAKPYVHRSQTSRVCPVCKSKFTPKRKDQATCLSQECVRIYRAAQQRKAHRRRHPVEDTTCLWCGSGFTPSRIGQRCCCKNHTAYYRRSQWTPEQQERYQAYQREYQRRYQRRKQRSELLKAA